jgi:hypothetical protein
MEDFKKELAALLEKHNVALICHSTKNQNDFSVEVGFQDMKNGFENEWTGRHHLGSFDIAL